MTIQKLEPLQGLDHSWLNKINELVDAVNELQKHEEQHLDLLTQLNEMRLHQTKEPTAPYAEQRKWIGCVCRFWYDNPNDTLLDYLDKIQTGKMALNTMPKRVAIGFHTANQYCQQTMQFTKVETMSDMKCPFCQQEMEQGDFDMRMFGCTNQNCEHSIHARTEYAATKAIWEELDRTKKQLELALSGLQKIADAPIGYCLYAEETLDQITALEQKGK